MELLAPLPRTVFASDSVSLSYLSAIHLLALVTRIAEEPLCPFVPAILFFGSVLRGVSFFGGCGEELCSPLTQDKTTV